MTRIIKFLLLLIALLLSPVFAREVRAQTINAASCSEGAVASALASINVDGTTVIVPPGDCVWTTSLSYTQTNSFTLQGAGAISGTGNLSTINGTGTDNTIIEDNINRSGGDVAALGISTIAGKSFRITGFAFKTHTGNTPATFNGVFRVDGASTSVRIDHNHFNQIFSVDMSVNDVMGVIDHNQFDSGYADEYSIKFFDSSWKGASGDGVGDASWNDSDNFGTSQFMFAENNNFRYAGTATATCSNDPHGFAFDVGLGGGREVFRYNAVGFHESLQTHGTSGGTQNNRGVRAFEIYENQLQYTTVPGDCFAFVVQLEGGASLWWGNTSTGYLEFINAYVPRYDNNTYGETPTPNGWGYCSTHQTGTGSAWDGNIASGYPCLDAIGRGKGDLLTGNNFPNILNSTTGTIAWPHQALDPLYTWGETVNKVTNNPLTYFANVSSAVLTENVDYYLEQPHFNDANTFNGTVGVGCGPTTGTGCANPVTQPSTCTAGVGYWNVTNQTLYVCAAGSVWNAYYTPFTYPHPLTLGQTSGNPVPPTNLAAVVQ